MFPRLRCLAMRTWRSWHSSYDRHIAGVWEGEEMQRLFRGMSKTDYQDVLRTIGHYIDQQGFTNIRLIETEDGLILQGRVGAGETRGEKRTETYLLTVDDVKQLMREAYTRRGRKL